MNHREYIYEAHLPRALGQLASELWVNNYSIIGYTPNGDETIFTFRGRKDRRAALVALHTHVKDILSGCRRDQPKELNDGA